MRAFLLDAYRTWQFTASSTLAHRPHPLLQPYNAGCSDGGVGGGISGNVNDG
ncbi:MAG: hypothetical protein R2795_17260 [Saprospiraceae bacterium]